MDFKRHQSIEQEKTPGRVLVIYGPRRIGKTTLVKRYAESHTQTKVKYDVGDDIRLQELFNSQVRKDILDYARPYKVIIIDEAQNVAKIGLATKMIIDEFPDKEIILTGSSSFDLSQNIGEPLTGRHFVMRLLPISLPEIAGSNYEKNQLINDLLIYGQYPEVLLHNTPDEKKRILNELVSSYLFKDVLALDTIKYSELLLNISRMLAMQIGQEVSYNEIANKVGADVKTIKRYIDILEKTFIIKKVSAYAKNPRTEITSKAKYYFYDLGVRNALLGQYNALANRNDVGFMWENFIFMELYKQDIQKSMYGEFYFWRTKTGIEIDIVYAQNGNLTAYECKWGKEKVVFTAFLENYPDAKTYIVNKTNVHDLL